MDRLGSITPVTAILVEWSSPFPMQNWVSTGIVSQFRHWCYLYLNHVIVAGETITITFPVATGLANSVFTFNDKTTRCPAIKTTQGGYRVSDWAKNMPRLCAIPTRERPTEAFWISHRLA